MPKEFFIFYAFLTYKQLKNDSFCKKGEKSAKNAGGGVTKRIFRIKREVYFRLSAILGGKSADLSRKPDLVSMFINSISYAKKQGFNLLRIKKVTKIYL